MPAANVVVSNYPANEGMTQLLAYDASTPANVEYVGVAKSTQPAPTTLTVASVSKAAAAVFTVTAHGLASDNIITVAGATGDWLALNGDRIITVLSVDTFSVAVDSRAFSGSFDAAATVKTVAPRTCCPIWSITKNYYGVNGAVRSACVQGSPAARFIWDNRTTYGYQ